jgi:hypothetical protein
MSTAEGNDAVLLGALKELNSYWERTAAVWKDAARERFERDCLQDLVEAVRTASNAISQIEVILRQIRRECA